MADVRTVTTVTRSVVPGTRVGRACVLAAREVDINTATLVVLTHGPIASSVTAARDMPVVDGHSALILAMIMTARHVHVSGKEPLILKLN